MHSIESLQNDIHIFSAERGWLKGVVPGEYAKSIVIEAAELLEVFQWHNPTAKELGADPAHLERVREELADVFIYGINLANLLALDVDDVIRSKMLQNAKRYPVALLRADASVYARLKEQYRKERVSYSDMP